MTLGVWFRTSVRALPLAACLSSLLAGAGASAADGYRPDPYGEDQPWVDAKNPFVCSQDGAVERLGYMDHLPTYNQGVTPSCYAFAAGLNLNAWRYTHGLGNGDEISPYNLMSDSAFDPSGGGLYPATALGSILDHPQAPLCTHPRSLEIVKAHIESIATKIDRVKASYLAHRQAIESIPDAADPALVAFRDRYRKAQTGALPDSVQPGAFCPSCASGDGNVAYYAGLWSSSLENVTQFFKDVLGAHKEGAPFGSLCFRSQGAETLFRQNDEFRWAVRFSMGDGVVFDYQTIRKVCVDDRANNPFQCDEIVDDLATCMKDYKDKPPSAYVRQWIKADCGPADQVVPFPSPAKVPRVVTHMGFAGSLGLGSTDRELLNDVIASISRNRQPLALVYDAGAVARDALLKKSFLDADSNHASSIIGYRCTDGRTQIQIRNSWGWCPGWARAGLECDGNDVWIDAGELFSKARSMLGGFPFRLTTLEP